jgi:chromosome segregation ATPase
MNTLPSLENVVSINNPEIILHAHYFRLVRLLAVNIEIYKQIRRAIPSFLHVRDYVAAIQKLLVKFVHTPEFYEEWMNINMVYYQMLTPNAVINNLFTINSELIGNLKKLKESKFYESFPAPNFSVYNDPYGTLTTGNLPGLGHVNIIHKPTDKPYKKTTYGVESMLSNSIHANEITEIMRNIHLAKGLVVGGARRKTKAPEDKYENIINSLLYPQLTSTMYYVQPNDLATKVAKLNVMFRGLVGNYCTSKGINPRDVKCLDEFTSLAERMQKNVCANGKLSDCLDNISNGTKHIISHADSVIAKPHQEMYNRIRELESANNRLIKEKSDINQQLTDATKKLSGTEKELSAKTADLKATAEKIQEQLNNKSSAETITTLDRLKGELAIKTKNAEELANTINTLSGEVNQLKLDKTQAEFTLTTIREELRVLRESHAQEIRNIIEKCTHDINDQKQTLEEAIKLKSQENDKLVSDIARIKGELESLKSSHKDGKDNDINLNEISRLKGELAEATVKLESAKAKVVEFINNQTDLTKKINILEDTIKDLSEAEDDLNESMHLSTLLRKTKEENERRITLLINDKIERNTKIAELSDNKVRLEQELKYKDGQNKKLIEEIAIIQKELESLKVFANENDGKSAAEITRLEGELNKANAALAVANTNDAELKKQIDEYQGLIALHNIMNDNKSKFDKMNADLNVTFDKNKPNPATLQAELEKTKTELDDAEQKRIHLEGIITQYKNTVDQLNSEILEQNTEITRLQEALDSAKTEIEHLQNANGQITKLNEDKRLLEERIDELSRTNGKALDDANEKHKELEERIRLLTADVENSKNNLKSLNDAEITRLLTQMRESDAMNVATIDSMAVRIKELEKALEDDITSQSIDDRIKTLETELAEKNKESENYKKVIKALEDQVEELRVLNKTNLAELEKLQKDNDALLLKVAEIETLKGTIATKEKELAAAIGQKEFFKKSIEEYNTLGLEAKNTTLSNNILGLEQKLKAAEAVNTQLSLELTSVKERLAKCEEKQPTEELNNNNNIINKQLEDITQRLIASEAALAGCTLKHKNLEAENVVLKEQLSNTKEIMNIKLEEIVNIITSELSTTRKRLTEIEDIAEKAQNNTAPQ